jgi:hypothetical protein
MYLSKEIVNIRSDFKHTVPKPFTGKENWADARGNGGKLISGPSFVDVGIIIIIVLIIVVIIITVPIIVVARTVVLPSGR